ncbi:uncharacterized oxidoreductase At1g06690, chloroplastic [Gossypium hirsutum]|uniref:Uncharacterized oxidoreductase At1g06690, chloroplastic n=1 Tax=Gossypium hirsutum TaxID=3635 RepID=A0ABM3AZN7_GOSHI|nr:uncharacterized oxidoreductase At1g06690, chloroplastic-like [Gossypium hirsutum]
MAMNVSSACFSVLSCKKPNRIRAVASEDFATTAALKTDTEDKLKLGGSELKVTRLGIGAWSWGDTSYWNNFQWDDQKLKAAKAAFNGSLDCGITFFDTAEVYGSPLALGAENSETLLGSLAYIFFLTQVGCHIFVSGALIGKYKPENPPSGPRGRIYTPEFLTKLQPLLIRIKEIGGNYGKTPTQVVLNWLIAQENVVPIPRAKNAAQAKEFVGALGWRLSNEEVDELRSLASEISPVTGFPVEKL